MINTNIVRVIVELERDFGDSNNPTPLKEDIIKEVMIYLPRALDRINDSSFSYFRVSGIKVVKDG